MKPVEVRNLKIGEGIPKICVPIVGITKEEIIIEAKALKNLSADLAEWRADWFCDVFDTGKVRGVLQELRDILGEMPLLFTFRTAREGGEKEIGPEAYKNLLTDAVQSGCIDLIDVEVFTGDDVVERIISAAHQEGVKVVASNHDFEKTPDQAEIVRRLCKMQALGADIPKIAVMPQSAKDVLVLLAATEEMHRKYARGPIITMAMGGAGTVSRLCGEVFGSAVTFGAAEKASAPGQIGARELAQSLVLLHENLCGSR